MLDPRFNLKWCDSEETDQNVLMLKQKTLSVQAVWSKADEDPSSPPSKRLKSDDLFSFMPSNTACARKRHQSGNANEVDIYLDEPCIDMDETPLKYWKLNANCFQF